MDKVLLPKSKFLFYFFLFIFLLNVVNVYGQSYDCMAQNEDGDVIYYKIDGSNAIVCSGDEKYSGIIRIPSSIIYNNNFVVVTAIGEKAFYFCKTLESVELPTSIIDISEYSFSGCSNLKYVNIPSNVQSIGISAFDGCENIESIVFPESLATIGQSAFYGCKKITKIKIPASVKSIGVAAFANSSALENISVDANNAYFDSRQNCNGIIESASNRFIVGCKNSVIPDGVTAIGEKAFYFCRTLESVELPSSIIDISEYSFSGCSTLKSVNIPSNVQSIGISAFNGCENIESILSQIKNPFEIDDNVFDQETKTAATLHVPKGSSSIYSSTKGWNFSHIIEDADDSNKEDNNNTNEDLKGEFLLVVWEKNGSRMTFPMSKNPKITFNTTDLKITGVGIDDTSYFIDNIVRFTYEFVKETAIKDIISEKLDIRLTKESILFPYLKANSIVSVYSLNGAIIFNRTIPSAGEYSFSISNLNTGVYIIIVNGLSYKIIKK